MNVIPSLVADRKPTVLGEPCQRALHNPPVSPRLLGTLRTLPSHAPLDASSSERPRALLVIVGFVGARLPGALSWPTTTRPARGPGGSASSTYASKTAPVVAPSTTSDGPMPSSVMLEISVTFLPQSRGAEHGARSPRLDQA